MVFGAPSHHVREVTRIDLVTPLPRAPGFILGAFGHRGEVLPVIDLLRFLNMGELRAAPRSRVFLGLGAQHVVAFLTDAVIGLRRVYVDDIMPRLAGGGTGEFLRGVATARDLGTLHLLDLQRVIAVAREKAVTR
jgi:purine-binding chemotaxis protein CheW